MHCLIQVSWYIVRSPLVLHFHCWNSCFTFGNLVSIQTEPSGGASGQASDIAIHAKEILRIRQLLTGIYQRHCGSPGENADEGLKRFGRGIWSFPTMMLTLHISIVQRLRWKETILWLVSEFVNLAQQSLLKHYTTQPRRRSTSVSWTVFWRNVPR